METTSDSPSRRVSTFLPLSVTCPRVAAGKKTSAVVLAGIARLSRKGPSAVPLQSVIIFPYIELYSPRAEVTTLPPGGRAFGKHVSP